MKSGSRIYSVIILMVLALVEVNCTTTHQAMESRSQARSLSSIMVPQSHYDGSTYIPYMSDLMGANGAPGDDGNADLWRKMGLRFSRIQVYPTDGADLQDMVNRGWIADPEAIDAKVKFNNSSGITTLILIGYSPKYTANVPGDDKSMPKDINAWQGYVNAVVDRYSKLGVKYFQVWNEAAGQIASAKQATFWHGPAASNGTYANAMEDYVSQIHIPAAIIIRRYGAYVVYGGWPCESSPGDYIAWLEHRSPSRSNNNMLDWVDYLDMHYYNVWDLATIFDHRFENGSTPYSNYGKVKGIWQTEVGDTGMNNPYSIASYFFNFAIFALDHKWDHPNKFVSMVYHYWGPEAFRLSFEGALHPPGMALKTLILETNNGPLAKFNYPITYGAGGSGAALKVGGNLVIQYQGAPGSRDITIPGLPIPRSYQVYVKNGANDTDISSAVTKKSWDGSGLKISLNMEDQAKDLSGSYAINKMVYIVVVPTW